MISIRIMKKVCTKCGVEKDTTAFNCDKTKKDGYYSSCKECKREKDKKSYRKNPKRKYEVVKAYMIKMGLFQKYKPYNPDFYKSGKSRLKKRARDLKRRTLKKGLYGDISIDVIKWLIEIYNGKCAYCKKDCSHDFHVEHKIPLSRGGNNRRENLALSCPSCNYSKGNMTLEEFLENRNKKENPINKECVYDKRT